MKIIKTINIVVFIAWTAGICLVLYTNYFGTSLERSYSLKEYFHKETYWYDIYRGLNKIGFAHTSFDRAGGEIIIRHEREMKVRDGSDEKVIIKKLKCLTDLFYSIKSFEYTSNYRDEEGIRVNGEVSEKTILFFHESPEKRWTKSISTERGDFYLPVTLIPVIHQKLPSLNKPFTVSMLNLLTLSINQVNLVLVENIPVKIGLSVRNMYKFRVGRSTFWTSEGGIVMKEKPPSGITLYSQSKDVAENPEDRMLFDFTSLPYFQSATKLSRTDDISLLRVKIRDFNLDPGLYENSTVSLKKDILSIRKETPDGIKQRSYTLPFTEHFLNDYLRADEWVSSDYKPLQRTGRIYASSHDHDAFQFARYLNSYLFQLIRTMPVFTLSDAEHVYKSLSGDFLERTVLYATYARAGGLPTRLVQGLVYVNGYFYFHAWPEVWFDNWVPVDPSLAQFPADVTHIPLRQGTLNEITTFVNDLKKLNIEIMEAS
jgi:hypothetical protein